MKEIKLADYLGCKENEVYNICGLMYKVVGDDIYYLSSDNEFTLDYNLFTLKIIKDYFRKHLIVRKEEYCIAYDDESKFLTLVKDENIVFTSNFYNDYTECYQKLFTLKEIKELKKTLNIELDEYDIIPLSEYEGK